MTVNTHTLTHAHTHCKLSTAYQDTLEVFVFKVGIGRQGIDHCHVSSDTY